ncbi:hypothetical protein IX317_001250 [Fusobacterium sp. DD29]|uniref:hypothetical protein n=1 Tax=unclassified Fusobacterium TaxID=2648384 RepID=UPI001B8C9516|nr:MULTISPECIES: hypothetical protein [unclassified Fusobacterium]MBR8700531.1 hypothetical protein [Fusobacterium sp. DD45]MBR8710280.1 hypothetical protein [Fusobacterium sp. DD28]MBR8749576.1 hypothetical protein [Fusobacterium sp. DD29]MBR8750834.1 hypothetical protein [Fusobacterium sp. DD26]MBR8761836.1 hypothetical protein [Fusobacterium sp. DD25]
MEIISKDKPKGKAYSKNKKMKKAKRLLEEKKFKRLTENKRKNAENRKEKAIQRENEEKIREVVLKDYNKGMFIVIIDGKEEKRAPIFDKSLVTKKNITDEFYNIQIKLYGDNYKISMLKGYNEVKEELIWKISEDL